MGPILVPFYFFTSFLFYISNFLKVSITRLVKSVDSGARLPDLSVPKCMTLEKL